MSGYLRRLAAAVNNPPSAIHPMAGSVFAGPEAEAPAVVHEEQIVTHVAAPLRREPPPAENTVAGDPEILEETRLLVRELRPAEQAEPGEADTIPAREPVSVVDREKAKLAVPLFPPQPDVSNEPAETALPFQPPRANIPGQRKQKTPVAIRGELEFPRSSYGLPPPGNVTRDSAGGKTSNVPGEIEIYIGRIEVTAVPPPANPPQPKPARKTPSLSEYLQRGRR
jgi:hypothetical protein